MASYEIGNLRINSTSACLYCMKWGAPVFFNASGKPVVYLYGGVDHANLGFLHGAQLDDPDRILKGNGVSGRHVKFHPDEAISKVTLEKLLRQCAKLK